MLWMEPTSWAEYLLVAGGLKPMACQWGVIDVSDDQKNDFAENPFISKFNSIGEFEEHMTEQGVIFHVEQDIPSLASGKTQSSEPIAGSDYEHRSYLISRDREIIDQFLGRFDGPFSPEKIGITGRLLGYPEDAIQAQSRLNIREGRITWDRPVSENYRLNIFGELEASAAIMRLRGLKPPSWINYVFHRPANGNLIGNFSESTMRQAKDYMAFIEETHPDFHEWYVDENDIGGRVMKDINCIVDWWESSGKT